jgi:hypothetical protein
MNPAFTRRWIGIVAITVVVLSLFSTVALADELYGRIRGTVSDPSGAVLPGVTIKATNVATGVSKTTVSSSDGLYEIPGLLPGTYSVSATKTGFAVVTTNDIKVLANQIYVNPISMQVGAVTEVVTVSANPAQVEQTSMQLTATISDKTITDLPLNGRNWVSLQQTLPGVVLPDTRFGNNFSTNGAQAQQNSYLVNGVDSNDLPLNSPLAPPNPDAISEVRMVTNSINPEFGRNSGAIMNATTKSGTNSFHGTAFEFYRDHALNTANYFQRTLNPDGSLKSKLVSPFHQHQYGGTVGGPIIKNKTFFFFSLQNTRNANPQTLSPIPNTFSSGMLAGNLSAFLWAGCKSAPGPACLSTNPTPFSINGFPKGTPWNVALASGTVNPASFNTVSKNLVAAFVPLPTAGNAFPWNPVTLTKANQYIGRLDQNFGTKDSVWFYAFANNQAAVNGLPFSGATIPGFGDSSPAFTKQFVFSWSHTLTNNILNEARVGYTRLYFISGQPVNVRQPSSVGFTNIFPQVPGSAEIPRINIAGYFVLGGTNNGPQPRKDQTYQVTDNFSWVKGRHSLKMGYEGRKFQVWNPFLASLSGNWSFDSGATYSTGDPGLDFLLGVPSTYGQGTGSTIIAQSYEHYLYFQDQFKLRNNLTVTFGTGYQIDQPIQEFQENGLARICFIPGQQSNVFSTAPVGINYPGDPGCNKGGGAVTKFTHFGPRLGFAYSPDFGRWTGGAGKTSIRGGFGVYYNRSEEELNLQDLGNPPFGLTSGGIGDLGGDPSFPNPFVDINDGTVLANKFPYAGVTPGVPVDFSVFLPMDFSTLSRDATVPYAMNYNLTLERELPAATILRVGYVGSQGRKLWVSRSFNPITPAGLAACLAGATNSKGQVCSASPNNVPLRFPQFFPYDPTVVGHSGIQYNGGESKYDSLQVTVDKHLSHGLQLLGTYTWSHARDTGSSFEDISFLTGGGFDAYGNLQRDYADSAFDTRHRFTLSGSYDIPNLNKLIPAIPSRVFGGWRFTALNAFQTGIPIQFQDSENRSLTCSTAVSFYSCPDRPDLIGPVTSGLDPRNSNFTTAGVSCTFNTTGCGANYFFLPNAFGKNALGTEGTTPRSFLHGPSFWNIDASIQKDTKITERTSIQLRAEAFNLLNHTNFANPTGSLTSANFGRITTIRNFTNSRLVQLGAKFIF